MSTFDRESVVASFISPHHENRWAFRRLAAHGRGARDLLPYTWELSRT
jgi:hypothetical protein